MHTVQNIVKTKQPIVNRDSFRTVKTFPKNYFLASFNKNIDHYIYYHDLHHSIEFVKKSDILIIGNSRALYGLDPFIMNKQFSPLHLKTYNLSFVFNEGSRFAVSLIEKHDLKPKYIIANIDRYFFESYSNEASFATSMSLFNARKLVFETEAAAYFARLLNVFFPNILNLPHPIFRCITNGAILTETSKPKSGIFLSNKTSIQISEDMLNAGKRFKEFLQERNIQPIFTYIPNGREDWSGEAQTLANAAQVPYVNISGSGLYCFDGSHLTKQSAMVNTNRFIEMLKKKKVLKRSD